MIIGIVSKPEHCQIHVRQLEQEGHTVKMLGGGNQIQFPPTLEVLIIRICSCSHGASEAVFAYAKKKNIPLIVQDGLSAIRKELDLLTKKPKPQAAPALAARPAPAAVATPPAEQPEQMSLLNFFRDYANGKFISLLELSSSQQEELKKFKGFPGQLMTFAEKLLRDKGTPVLRLETFNHLYKQIAGEEVPERVFNPIARAAHVVRTLTDAQIKDYLKAFLAYDEALELSNNVNYPVGTIPLKGEPGPFIATHMMIIPPEVLIRRRTFVKCYASVNGGSQLDPKAFTFLKEAFGFKTEPEEKKTPKVFVETPEVTTTANVSFSSGHVSPNTEVLASVQEDLLKTGIQVESFGKDLDAFKIQVNDSFHQAGVTAEKLRLENAKLQEENSRLRVLLESKISALTTLDSKMSLREKAVEDTLNRISQLEENLKKVQSSPKPAVDSMENVLERMSKLGAAVTISIPGKTT